MEEDTNIMSEPSKETTTEPSNTSSAYVTNEQLASEMAKLRQELSEKDDTISQLHDHITWLETETEPKDWSILSNKKRKFSNSAQSGEGEGDEQITILIAENEQLKKRLDELERQKTTDETSTCKCRNITQNTTSTTNTTTVNTTDIVKIIEEKLSIGLCSIKENVNQLIETKLNTVQTPNEATPVDPKLYSYATAVGENQISGNLKTIMMATKNEEIAEQAEKKRRGKSIMVFGRREHESDRWKKADDEEFAEQFIKDIQAGQIKVKEMSRIGTFNVNDSKIRPLKITLNSEEEQQKIMGGLRNLKDNENYKGISIKEDYTINERQLIKSYTEQAKTMNELERAKKSTTVYKVRGTPKNGLFLKRFTIQRDTTEASTA